MANVLAVQGSVSDPVVLCGAILHDTLEDTQTTAECLQAMRQALWAAYGPQMQQAWREQLVPHQAPHEFDPDEPF